MFPLDRIFFLFLQLFLLSSKLKLNQPFFELLKDLSQSLRLSLSLSSLSVSLLSLISLFLLPLLSLFSPHSVSLSPLSVSLSTLCLSLSLFSSLPLSLLFSLSTLSLSLSSIYFIFNFTSCYCTSIGLKI